MLARKPNSSPSLKLTCDDANRQKRDIGRVKTGRAHQDFARSLKGVAEHISTLIDAGISSNALNENWNVSDLTKLLHDYSTLLHPWAQQVAARMLSEVNARDLDTWRSLSQELGIGLRHEIQSTHVGALMASLLAEQTESITSLPIEAAQRIQLLSVEAMMNSERSSVIREEILNTGEVEYSRAKMLARTLTSTASTLLTQSRATAIGSEGYIWETQRDGTVRPSHRAMQGKFVRWDEPPTIDNYTAHCGMFANCRCYPRVQIPRFD